MSDMQRIPGYVLLCGAAAAAGFAAGAGCDGRVLLTGDAGWQDGTHPDFSFDPSGEDPPVEEADAAQDISTDDAGEPRPLAWARTYGDEGTDWLTSIIRTADGGYIALGRSEPPLSSVGSVRILKLDPGGSVTWEKTLSLGEDDYPYAVRQTSDGGYVAAGTSIFRSGDSNSFWSMRMDAAGNVVWLRSFGEGDGSRANDVLWLEDGGIVVVGETWSGGPGSADWWVVRLDAGGAILWQKAYGGAAYDDALSVLAAADGGYLVSGYSYSFDSGTEDFWILRLDESGGVVWQKAYEGGSDEAANAVGQAPDGGYIVAGATGTNGIYSLVLRLDPEGDPVWQYAYHQSGYASNGADAVAATGDGGFIVASKTHVLDAGMDIWLLKLDGDGRVQWQRTFGGRLDEEADTVEQTPDGGFIVGGTTSSFGAGDKDFWVLKLDPEGGISDSCPPGMIGRSEPQVEEASLIVQETSVTPREDPVAVTDESATAASSTAQVEVQCSL